MCSCPSDFVHGLVLPRKPVTGVEDPNRPDGIWQIAWDVGTTKINDNTLALVVNPKSHRSQDQLHVHIVQLKPDARSQMSGTTIINLDSVWGTAAQLAEVKGLSDYGVLVAQNPQGGYLVVIDTESPEYKFTVATCE
jgi:CDP-diacylglycerol pyrophosphatase